MKYDKFQDFRDTTLASGDPVEIGTVIDPGVNANTVNLTNGPAVLTIQGTGFDPAGKNLVTLYTDSTGADPIPASAISSVVPTSSSELTVILNTAYPLPNGPLYATVTTDNLPLPATNDSSQYVYQVANVVGGGPTITLNPSNLASNATSLVISGTNFSSTLADDTVTLDSVGGTLATTATAVDLEGGELALTLDSPTPLPLGQLYATVTTPTAESSEVLVGTVVTQTTAPTVTSNPTNTLAPDVATLEIGGTGFDTSPGANNLVSLFGPSQQLLTSVQATAVDNGTQLLVTLNPANPLPVGTLYATVTVDGVVAGTLVVVGNVASTGAPTITPPETLPTILPTATTLTIQGTNFDPSGTNEVTLYSDGQVLYSEVQSVDATSSMDLSVTLSTSLPLGTLSASVTVDSAAMAGPPVAIATVALTGATISPGNTPVIAGVTTTLEIQGTGFDDNDQVVFTQGGAGSIVQVTPTQLTVQLTTPPTAGILMASVVDPANGLTSPLTPVATVYPSLAAGSQTLPAGTTTLTLSGAGFSSIPADNVVQFSSGAVGTVVAVSPALNELTVALSTPPTQAGTLYATVSVNGLQSTAVLATVAPGQPSPATSLLGGSAELVLAGQTVTLTLQARDAYGNPLTSGGASVTFNSTLGGTFGPVQDNGNGTYTATFQSLSTGLATFTATLNGAPVSATASTTVYIGSDTQQVHTSSTQWAVHPAALGASNPSGTVATVALYRGVQFENGAVSITVANVGRRKSAMIVARYLNNANYYRAGIKYLAGKPMAVIQVVQNGRVATLARTPVNFNGSGVLALKTTGSSLLLSLNQDLVASATNAQFQSGKVGYYSAGHANVVSFRASAASLPESP